MSEPRGTFLSNRAGDAARRGAAERAKADLWREIADELAEALSEVRLHLPVETPPWRQARAALRRYEEARNE